jgi:myosin-5
MELGAHVWLRSDTSQWGWIPARITGKDNVVMNGVNMINLTLKDDPADPSLNATFRSRQQSFQESFETTLTVDPEQLKAADHEDIKLRNMPTSFQLSGEDPEAGVIASPSTKLDDSVVGGVDDLIGLTHLHEPAILHALRLRYDADIIYTATGPILIAVNPFKPMGLYSDETMEQYRRQGEQGVGGNSTNTIVTSNTPFKRSKKSLSRTSARLPPHAYQTADDAYRAMIRGLENTALMGNRRPPARRTDPASSSSPDFETPANQSILVSGESGAGKTVTTKIVLNYFAMLSKKRAQADRQSNSPRNSFSRNSSTIMDESTASAFEEEVTIEQQVLQSNPILESFGNARTIRNDNSSRFGKYIDIRFTPSGKLSGASIETYLLEKVRLIHPSAGERNYHVFYQFLASATQTERRQFFLGNKEVKDFKLLSQTTTYDRRDGVSDSENHQEMLDAMVRSKNIFSFVFHMSTLQNN